MRDGCSASAVLLVVPALVALILCCPPGSGVAQTPVSMPPQTAVLDTAQAVLAGPEAWPCPAALYVVPDSVTFGDAVTIVVDFPPASIRAISDSLVTSADWLVLTEVAPDDGAGRLASLGRRLWNFLRPPVSPHRIELEALPAPEPDGLRVTRLARVLRSGPFQVRWVRPGVSPSALTHVTSRLETGDAAAPIRNPRAMGWRWWNMVAGLTVLVLAAWLMTCLRGRRVEKSRPVDAELTAPAWLKAALELHQLHRDELPSRGEGRVFLDRLAATTRVFVHGRFGVRAVEMTAPEIAAALRLRGFRRAEYRPLVLLLSECDVRRYCPDLVDAASCRELFAGALIGIAAVRVEARFTPVPADLDIAATKAWAVLIAEIGTPAGTQVVIGEGGVA